MTGRVCLRCDWQGATVDRRCPSCGARSLFVSRPGVNEPRAALGPSAAPPVVPPATEPREGAPDDGSAGFRGGGSAVLSAAAIVLVAIVAIVSGGRDGSTGAAPSAVSDAEAVAVARSFLEAYGDLDAERASGRLARDADFSLMIRSVGADHVDGTLEEFRLLVSMLEAWRYRQEVGPCDVIGRSGEAVDVRCAFSYDFLGSDVLGSGPYTGSSFDLTVRGDEVVSASTFWAFDRFAREVWEPFGEWVAAVYPNDARRMYDDPDRRGVRLDEASIRRWERHTGDYLRTQLERSLIGDLLRAPTTTVLGSPVPRWTETLP